MAVHSNRFVIMGVIALSVLFLSGCGKRSKLAEHLDFNELQKEVFSSLDAHDKQRATVCLEQLVTKHADHKDIARYKIMLADLYYDAQRYEECYELYAHFAQMFPSDTKAEYAHYRKILSKFHQTLGYDRDITLTAETLRLCTEYKENLRYLVYRKEIDDIQRTCNRKLIDHEVYVYNFYLRQGKLKSAEKRLDYLREHCAGKEKNFEAQLLYLEGKLAHKRGESTIVQEKVTQLATRYTDSTFTKMARGLIPNEVFLF
jgi:outer membrane assembly lipoprotein YfiO